MAFRSRNDLRVRGTIVFIRSGETGAGVPFVNIRIVTDSGPRKDYPMFRFYGESATIAAKFERGNRVLVTGHASLRRKLDENRQPTNGYQQLLIGDSIEMSKRELSRYLNLTSDHMSEYDGGHMRDENGAFVTGEVVHTYEINDETAIVTVLCERSKNRDRVNISCFKRQAELAKTLKPGDVIAAAGLIQTKNMREQRKIVQSLVARDMALDPNPVKKENNGRKTEEKAD